MPIPAVRRVNEWDAPSMLKIYAPYTGTHAAEERKPPELQEYIQRIDRYTYGMGWLLCQVDSIPLGFCHLTEDREEPEDPFSAGFQLYGKPGFLRMGVGSALWALTRDMMEEEGYRQVSAWVHRENQPALAFFEAMGFAFQGWEGEEARWRYALSPKAAPQQRPIKPYLLDKFVYEAARERAAGLVRLERLPHTL